MIPEFDARSEKLQEFLTPSTYAKKNINVENEEVLLDSILYTKLKGKAMIEFKTQNICNFEDLKRQLETSYQSKRSTIHLHTSRF